jgi:hypothetical protein
MRASRAVDVPDSEATSNTPKGPRRCSPTAVQCGQDDLRIFNCEVAELSVMGDPAGRVEAYVAGN